MQFALQIGSTHRLLLLTTEDEDKGQNHHHQTDDGDDGSVATHTFHTTEDLLLGTLYAERPTGTLDGSEIEETLFARGFIYGIVAALMILHLDAHAVICLIVIVRSHLGYTLKEIGSIGMADEAELSIDKRHLCTCKRRHLVARATEVFGIDIDSHHTNETIAKAMEGQTVAGYHLAHTGLTEGAAPTSLVELGRILVPLLLAEVVYLTETETFAFATDIGDVSSKTILTLGLRIYKGLKTYGNTTDLGIGFEELLKNLEHLLFRRQTEVRGVNGDKTIAFEVARGAAKLGTDKRKRHVFHSLKLTVNVALDIFHFALYLLIGLVLDFSIGNVEAHSESKGIDKTTDEQDGKGNVDIGAEA